MERLEDVLEDIESGRIISAGNSGRIAGMGLETKQKPGQKPDQTVEKPEKYEEKDINNTSVEELEAGTARHSRSVESTKSSVKSRALSNSTIEVVLSKSSSQNGNLLLSQKISQQAFAADRGSVSQKLVDMRHMHDPDQVDSCSSMDVSSYAESKKTAATGILPLLTVIFPPIASCCQRDALRFILFVVVVVS